MEKSQTVQMPLNLRKVIEMLAHGQHGTSKVGGCQRSGINSSRTGCEQPLWNYLESLRRPAFTAVIEFVCNGLVGRESRKIGDALRKQERGIRAAGGIFFEVHGGSQKGFFEERTKVDVVCAGMELMRKTVLVLQAYRQRKNRWKSDGLGRSCTGRVYRAQ